MSRFLMLIAVVFAFASVGGASASYAQGGQASHGEFATIGDVAEECAPTAAAPKIAAYKPCTKKLNGIAIPCPHQPSVLPAALAASMPEFGGEPVAAVAAVLFDRLETERQFRPPRA